MRLNVVCIISFANTIYQIQIYKFRLPLYHTTKFISWYPNMQILGYIYQYKITIKSHFRVPQERSQRRKKQKYTKKLDYILRMR